MECFMNFKPKDLYDNGLLFDTVKSFVTVTINFTLTFLQQVYSKKLYYFPIPFCSFTYFTNLCKSTLFECLNDLINFQFQSGFQNPNFYFS